MRGIRFRLKRLLSVLTPGVLALAVGSPALAAEGTKYPQALLDPAGPQAESLAEVISWDLQVITGIFIAVSLITAYILIKFRRREGADAPEQSHGNPRFEVTAWLVLVMGLLVMMVHPLKAEGVFVKMPTDENAVDVEVIGHQWWWEIRYPKLGIVTANELHMPTGVPVRIRTTSVDVIHSFAIPRLGGKDESIPGRWTQFWLQADEPGIYQGQCMQLCGASHARMLARAVAQTPADFDAWVQSMKNPVTTPQTELAQRGEQLFGSNCAACHTVDGTAFKGKVGPNQTGFGYRTSIGGGVLENNPQNLARWIADPQSVKPGTKMPKLPLSKDAIDALVAYMEGLK